MNIFDDKPKAIYQAEYTSVLMFGGLLVSTAALGLYCLVAAIAPSLPKIFAGVIYYLFLAGMLFGLGRGSLWVEKYATYRALLRCQKTGLLQYVRTREVLKMRPQERRPGEIQYPGSEAVRRQYIVSVNLFVVALALLTFGIWAWLGWPSLLSAVSRVISSRISLLFLVFGLGFNIVTARLRHFSISQEKIKLPFRSIRWSDVAVCHIERDYGAPSPLETLPNMIVTFFAANGSKLGELTLREGNRAKREDYVELYEALLANLGYPPEPGLTEPKPGCAPEPTPMGDGFGAI